VITGHLPRLHQHCVERHHRVAIAQDGAKFKIDFC